MSSSSNDVLSITLRPDGVAVLTYDVPGESVNTLKASFADAFRKAFAELAANPKAVAVVLASGKPDSFIAGADIEMLKTATTAAQAQALAESGHRVMAELEAFPKPVVAAVHGPALGGGFEVALGCHARVLSSDPKTSLALPEVQLGVLPGMNGLQRLARIVGLQAALDFGLTGKAMRPHKAKQLGVASDVVAKAILLDVAAELALKMAQGGKPFTAPAPKKKTGFSAFNAAYATQLALEKNPLGRALLFKKARETVIKKTGGHYPAPLKIIEVIRAFAERGFEPSKQVEAQAFGELVMSDVARELMGIFFATTALKKDSGTDDATVKPREVQKIAMLGAGLMGAGIAYVSVNAGIPVRLKDRDDASVGKGLKYVADIFDGRAKRKAMTKPEAAAKMALLSGTTDYSGVRSADLVIEAVFEDLGVKHKVLAEVEAATGPNTIFASNTSSIPITKIAAGAKRPENVVGMHYFSPVHKMPLLEIIQTKSTSPEVVATAVAVGKKQGKTVIVVNDGVGFYTSRILGPYMNEASWLLMEGYSIEQIDKALTAWGWPVGPITLLDEVGIDVAAHVGPIMIEAFGDRMLPPPTVQRLVADDRKGRKNERGFYLYGDAAKKKGKGKHVDESIYAVLGLPSPNGKRKVDTEELQRRCSLQFINEAFHCLGEGIVRSPRDGDIGAIFGLGFPPFLGGPFRYVDRVGAGTLLQHFATYEAKFGKRWQPAPLLQDLAKSGKKLY